MVFTGEIAPKSPGIHNKTHYPLPVDLGGTGNIAFTNTNALVTSGTDTQTPFQEIASVATGSVLVSNGTSTLPSWSSTPTVASINLGNTTLTTYIEGTWTPNLQINGSNTGITYTTQLGWYTRINNLVLVSFVIALSSKGANTGAVTISNMPVAYGANGLNQSFVVAQTGHSSGTSLTTFSVTGSTSSAVGQFFASNINGNVGSVAVTDANLTNTTAFKSFGGYSIL